MSRDSALALSRDSYESPFLRPRIPKFYRHNTPPLPQLSRTLCGQIEQAGMTPPAESVPTDLEGQ